jgi:hypothetical protein
MDSSMFRSWHYINNPITGDDGYHIRAADAVQIEKFMKGIRKALKGGGLFVKSIKRITREQLVDMLYRAYEGRMPMSDANRICQSDILLHFGLGIVEELVGCIEDCETADNEIAKEEVERIVALYKLLRNDGYDHTDCIMRLAFLVKKVPIKAITDDEKLETFIQRYIKTLKLEYFNLDLETIVNDSMQCVHVGDSEPFTSAWLGKPISIGELRKAHDTADKKWDRLLIRFRNGDELQSFNSGFSLGVALVRSGKVIESVTTVRYSR